jgi:hypothetical protein
MPCLICSEVHECLDVGVPGVCPRTHVPLVSASRAHLLELEKLAEGKIAAGQSVVDATLTTLGESSAAEPLVSPVVEQILGRAPLYLRRVGGAQHRGLQVNHPG